MTQPSVLLLLGLAGSVETFLLLGLGRVAGPASAARLEAVTAVQPWFGPYRAYPGSGRQRSAQG